MGSMMHWPKASDRMRASRPWTTVATALLLVAVLGGAILLFNPQWDRSIPSPQEQSDARQSLVREVTAGFDGAVTTVTVGYLVSRDRYEGRFSLRAVPVALAFGVSRMDLTHYGPEAGLPGLELVHPVSIGGAERLVSLAFQYHKDFPSEGVINYYMAGDWLEWNDGRAHDAVKNALGASPGPSVVAYGSQESALNTPLKVLGVYTWSQSSSAWRLVLRGPLASG